MKKKYTKAKVEIIPLKTEAGICTDSEKNTGTAGGYENGGGDPDPDEERDSVTAKAFDGNGMNNFPFDPTPSTKA